MEKHLYICIIIFFVGLLFAADVPRVVNYQGKLLDNGGSADGYYYFRYAIYSPGASPETLWVQTHPGGDSIYVNNGLFSDTLGLRIDTVFAQSANLWLKVFVQKPPFNSANWTALGDGEKLWASAWALTIADTAITDAKIRWSAPGSTPSAGQVSAEDVPIEDAGGYYTIDNVEAALQQIAGGGGSSQWSDSTTYITNNNATSNDLHSRIFDDGNVSVGTTDESEKLNIAGRLSLLETTSPSATANYGKLYIKSADSKLYFMDDGGVEHDLTATGGGENLSQTLAIDSVAGGHIIDMQNRSIRNVATPTTSDSAIGPAVSANFLLGKPTTSTANWKLYTYRGAGGGTAGAGGDNWGTQVIVSDAPLSGDGTSSSQLVISQANATTDGYLSSTDWTTFNNKVSSVTASAPIVSSGGTTPDISMQTSGVTAGSYTNTNLTVDAYGRITAASNGSASDDDWTLVGDTLYSAPDSTVVVKDGNVGIGTTSPSEKLDVEGNIEMNSNLIKNVATPTTGVSAVGDAVSTKYLNGNSKATSTDFKLYSR